MKEELVLELNTIISELENYELYQLQDDEYIEKLVARKKEIENMLKDLK